MNCLKRLNDVFPNAYLGTGIFSVMNEISSLPFEATPSIMDVEYFGNVSGDKIVSPLIDKIVVNSTASQSESEMLAQVIINMYYKRWEKLYNTFLLEYNPIQNYDMLEEMTDDETVQEYGKTSQRTDNLTHTKTGNDTETNNLQDQRTDNLSDARTDNLSRALSHNNTETHNTTETETPNLVNSTDNKIFGFDSSIGVDSDSQTVTATGSTSKAKTGTVGNSGTDSETNTGTQTTQHTGTSTNAKTGTVQYAHNIEDNDTGTQNIIEGGEDTTTRNYTLHRTGNIGVTTSQQMIESERMIWMWDFFHSVIFPDVDKILTIPIY